MKKNIIESKSKLTPDDLNILRHLESEQKVSQRDLSNSLGISLGKVNFIIRALINKGIIKAKNFKNNKNKRAYAYYLLSDNREMSSTAEKRLYAIQSIEGLGAGFSLAAHDLDIRGAGNLLGDEQSGQIKEVGVSLYQQLLNEAVSDLKGESRSKKSIIPQIKYGVL